MAVGFSNTNKPINPRGQDASPLAYNRAKLYSGKALDFDGVNDSVDIGQNLGFINTGDFTFLANAKFDVLSGDECIMGQGSAGAGLAVLALVNGNGFFRFAFYGDDLDWDEPVETGKWYSLAFTFNRTTKARAIYVNGQLAVSDVSTLTPNASINNFAIGKVPYSATYADAQITGVKVFSTALTAAQVSDLYNNPEKVVPTGVDNTALKLWLPMMEGAGTTAYDGSGNGNHGTISGATYVNGIGAPSPQSAVMDWNKGTNILEYSIWNNSYWTASGGVVTDGIEAPDGTNTAFKFERDGAFLGAIYKVAPTGLSSTNYRYVYAKLPSGTGSAQLMSHNTNTNNTFTITDEWQRFELNSAPNTAPTNFYIVDFRGGVGVDEIHLWAPQAAAGTDESVFVPTIGTSQDTPVLLPQGLTSGRDITGVNLFENVRKQGALNLDGNSWAEVHDNASLDVTTGVSVEAWVDWVSPSASKGILSKWGAVDFSWLFQARDNSSIRLYIRDSANYLVESSTLTEGWRHLCATYDGVTLRMYVDGQADTTTAHTGSIDIIEEPVKIGAYGAITSTTYEHDIAQPRIYNRALTAEEVLRNYNSGKNTYK